jgi:catechol 2,3-dioxygenase-like lactoylglutathione lyase family enzyme
MENNSGRAFLVDGIDHVAITVSDLDRSMGWYTDVLGLERRHEEAWGDMPVMLFAGTTGVALFRASMRQPAESPNPRTSLIMRHLAFRVSRSNFEAAQKDLNAREIPFEFQDHAISQSIYFRDPDNYELELTTYE